jgi:hypothetical protein
LPLNWSSHEHIIGAVTATGRHGVYSIQQVGPHWILHGVGHDNLTQLPGDRFLYLEDAQSYAERIDDTHPVESQASGA